VMEWLVALGLVVGSLFAFLAAVGILRMPDTVLRLQTATKAGTMGVGCILLAVAIFFGDTWVALQAGLTVIFLFITAPISAHLIYRICHLTKVPFWSKTTTDEL
jgi:multicomponent Na+:H+ antiporter subunit G